MCLLCYYYIKWGNNARHTAVYVWLVDPPHREAIRYPRVYSDSRMNSQVAICVFDCKYIFKSSFKFYKHSAGQQ